jgi:4-amino-4-deoxy-L-arabinose transferase-like glycosyltransferase
MTTADSIEDRHLFRLALIGIGAITLVRIAVLIASPLQLYPDEAQYWWWAQTPDLGYFSKPPLIAWLIWLTTTLFGNAEWAIRIASPLLHAAASLFVFGIAGRVFNARIALWSALAYLTAPGISYSSGLISTDVPLLLCWAVALYAFLRGLDDKGLRWTLLCGVALGLGLLSKYAMLYFLLGAVAAALVVPEARRLMFGWRGLAILLIGLALVAPNVLWNAAHGFPTVAHTEANAGWDRAHFNIRKVADFFLGQFGVFGPFLMAGMLAALWRLARGPERPAKELILAAFCLPPFALLLVQSFIAEANANWAAVTFVAGTPLAVNALYGWRRARALWASFAIDGIAMIGLWTILAAPSVADAVGLGNAFKREEGWRELGAAVAKEASHARYDAIATDNRSVIAELLYYTTPRTVPVRMWDRDVKSDNHFQMTLRLERPARRVLLVVSPEDAPRVLPTFDSATRLDRLTVGVGGHRTRVTELYDAHDYRGPLSP